MGKRNDTQVGEKVIKQSREVFYICQHYEFKGGEEEYLLKEDAIKEYESHGKSKGYYNVVAVIREIKINQTILK